jgi:hypothetical protein
MCLIAHRTVNGETGGSNIPNNIIDYNRRMNGDGFGIAWRDPKGGLKYQKFGPKDFDAFRSLLKKIDKKTTIEYVAHWRKATHGAACLDLSHPFTYTNTKDGEVLVFHNGIISGLDTDEDNSDTSVFVDEVLSNLPSRWWEKAALKWMVENSIGWSRLLVMTNDTTVRLNEKDWKTVGGIRYSTFPGPVENPQKGAYSGGAIVPYTAPGTTVRGQLLGDGLWTPDEDEDEEDVIAVSGKEWYHLGHPVSPLTGGDGVDETFGAVACNVCQTMGDYYVVEGKRYIDLRHQVGLL